MKIIGNVDSNDFIVQISKGELARLIGFGSFYNLGSSDESKLKPGWEMDISLAYDKLVLILQATQQLDQAKDNLTKCITTIENLLPITAKSVVEDLKPENSPIKRAVRVREE